MSRSSDPTRRAGLTLFAHLARRPDATLDLGQAALLIAEPFVPGLDIAYHMGIIDRLGDEARRRVGSVDPASAASVEAGLGRVLRLLFDEVGFRGNTDDYGDPRNSFLSEVLDRRLGIPITLAVVIIEVSRRAGLLVSGVSFPQHFLVRAETANGPRFVDPFEGKLLTGAALGELGKRALGSEGLPDERLLQPATKAQILVRMLNNLRRIFEAKGDRESLQAVLARLSLLLPDDSEIARLLSAIEGAEPGQN